MLGTTVWHRLLYYLGRGLVCLLASASPCKAAKFLEPCLLQQAEHVLVKVWRCCVVFCRGAQMHYCTSMQQGVEYANSSGVVHRSLSVSLQLLDGRQLLVKVETSSVMSKTVLQGRGVSSKALADLAVYHVSWSMVAHMLPQCSTGRANSIPGWLKHNCPHQHICTNVALTAADAEQQRGLSARA